MAESFVPPAIIEAEEIGASSYEGSRPARTFSLSDLRDLVFILTIFVFFAGFLYRYYYLTDIGIPPGSVDEPLNTILVYAFSVLAGNAEWAIVFIIATGFLVAFFASNVRARAAIVPYRLYFLALASLLCFVLLYLGAQRVAATAASDVKLGRSYAIPRVTLALKSRHNNYPKIFRDAVATGAALLLSVQSDRLYVLIRQDPLPQSPRSLPDMFLYVVPLSDVDHYNTLVPGCQGCIDTGRNLP